jgi:4-hydroxy-tetrahydrodipicolinate synthase
LRTIRRVCELGRVAAIKDSSGRVDVGRELAATTGVPVFQGCERLLTESGGLAGTAVGLANLEPELCATAYRDASTAGDVAQAVRRYGLDGPQWYRACKRELVRRNVIRTSAIVGGASR